MQPFTRKSQFVNHFVAPLGMSPSLTLNSEKSQLNVNIFLIIMVFSCGLDRIDRKIASRFIIRPRRMRQNRIN